MAKRRHPTAPPNPANGNRKPRAFDRIMAGLEDALAFARGDESRGTLIEFRVKDGKAYRVRPKPKLTVVR